MHIGNSMPSIGSRDALNVEHREHRGKPYLLSISQQLHTTILLVDDDVDDDTGLGSHCTETDQEKKRKKKKSPRLLRTRTTGQHSRREQFQRMFLVLNKRGSLSRPFYSLSLSHPRTLFFFKSFSLSLFSRLHHTHNPQHLTHPHVSRRRVPLRQLFSLWPVVIPTKVTSSA